MTSWPVSRITRWCAISFLMGIAVVEWVRVPWLWIVVALWIGCIAVTYRSNIIVKVTGWCIFAFALGLCRSVIAMPVMSNTDVGVFNEKGMRQWEGVITAEPDVRETQQKLTVRVKEYKEGDQNYNGLILIDAPSYPWFSYGDYVRFGCSLEEPFVIPDFSYKDYLARRGIFAYCRNPLAMESVDHRKGSLLLGYLYSFKQWMVQGINSQLSEPHSTLLSGILFGARSGFPKDVAQHFSIVGLTHIVAISGYNITVVMVSIAGVFRALRVRRKRATIAILTGVALFSIFAGASSSTIRAAIMGALVLIAAHTGRTQHIGHTLLLAAVIMVGISPSILLHDAGFQLSFLATLGLVYGTPVITDITKKIPLWKWLREVLVQTGAAILFTTPLIVVQFSSFSVIALIANIFILPFIPLVMVLGFILVLSNIVGFLLGPLGAIYHIFAAPLSWATWLVLSYILKITEYLSQIPYASIGIVLHQWSWVFFVLSYGLLSFIIWAHGRIHKPSTSDVSGQNLVS